MKIYRVRVLATNEDGDASRVFRYDVKADSPTHAAKNLPDTHYADSMAFSEWEIESIYIRRNASQDYYITGVDERSEKTLYVSCMGKHAHEV